MRHAAARERVAQIAVDSAAIADDERAHLAAFDWGQALIDKVGDSIAHVLQLREGKLRMMREDLIGGSINFLRGDSHRRTDSFARHESFVVVLAGISVVARKADSRSYRHLVADARVHLLEDRHPHNARRRGQWGAGNARAQDSKSKMSQIGKMLRFVDQK